MWLLALIFDTTIPNKPMIYCDVLETFVMTAIREENGGISNSSLMNFFRKKLIGIYLVAKKLTSATWLLFQHLNMSVLEQILCNGDEVHYWQLAHLQFRYFA